MIVGDDNGLLRLFNYPAVAHYAPSVNCTGHSSHVLDTRFCYNGDSDIGIVTIGGNDCTVINWSLK